MKLLEVIEGDGWCGTKEQTYLITSKLSKYYNVELALAFGHKEMIERLENKVPLRFYEIRKNRFSIGNYKRLYKIIKEGNYDIITPNSSLAFNYCLFVYPFLDKKPKIIAMRRCEHIPSFISKYMKYRIASKIVVVSKGIFEKLKGHNFFLEKLRVIESGVDLSRFKPLSEYRNKIREELGIRDNEKVFINIANWQPKIKGQDVLLKAFKVLNRNDCRLVMVGHGTNSLEAKKFIEDLGIEDKILTLGFRNDVEKLLQGVDYFILSSNSEGMGGALLEAMASGKVVLSTNVGGISKYLENGKNGFIVPCKDVDSLAKKMERMLSLSSDEYKDLSEEGVKTAKDHSIEENIKKWKALIEEIRNEKAY